LRLAGCAAIDELKETFLRWVESEKLLSGRGVFADELPEATPMVPPEKTPKEPSKRRPQPKDTARKLQRPQTVVLPPKKPPIPDSIEPVRPEGTEGQSAPSQPAPRQLPSRWPEAPPGDLLQERISVLHRQRPSCGEDGGNLTVGKFERRRHAAQFRGGYSPAYAIWRP
jgi:hypothetical protein